ncbi:MAG TPA: class I SAM-dependent methyltransferase [Pseudolabrys sp.]|nr:class I SAM-dependent methyltransferase [Pseudolabrys sp.]
MGTVDLIKNSAKRIIPARGRYMIRQILNAPLRGMSSAQYWTRHNVTEHRRFPNAQASFEYFNWRNSQYPGSIELLPLDQASGKVVLDYGCGPGNDLVGFSLSSKPKRMIGADVSTSSIAESKARLATHGFNNVELIVLSGTSVAMPIADRSIDIVHSAGVLHHLPDIEQALREIRRVIADTGYCQIMVYNYNSIWMHLYAGHVYKKMFYWRKQIPKQDIFKITTDGEECPIVNCYTPDQFAAIAARCGFRCEFQGAAMSLSEMMWLPRRFEALKNESLDPEGREFLLNLTFDHRGFPMHRGHVAGVNSYYRLYPV